MFEQIRTIDKARFMKLIGNIGCKKMKELNRSLTVSLGL